jgi:hypothetical protein
MRSRKLIARRLLLIEAAAAVAAPSAELTLRSMGPCGGGGGGGGGRCRVDWFTVADAEAEAELAATEACV